MKKIFSLLVFVSLLFCLVGCEEEKIQSEETRFYTVYSEFGSDICVDADTGVMYLHKRGSGGLSVMVDPEGKPLIWEELR